MDPVYSLAPGSQHLDCFKEAIVTPLDNDVLCGKSLSTMAQSHPGNRLLRDLIQTLMSEYNASQTKQHKMRIIRRIIRTMQNEYGSRFISRGDDGGERWYLVEYSAIRDKISGVLRYGSQKRQSSKKVRAGSIGSTSTNSSNTTLVSAMKMTKKKMYENFIVEPVSLEDFDYKKNAENLLVLHKENSQILEQLLTSSFCLSNSMTTTMNHTTTNMMEHVHHIQGDTTIPV